MLIPPTTTETKICTVAETQHNKPSSALRVVRYKSPLQSYLSKRQNVKTEESSKQQACAQLPTYTINVALPTFACHMSLLLSGSHTAIDPYLLLATATGPTAVKLQQLVCCSWPMMEHKDGQTHREMDGYHVTT